MCHGIKSLGTAHVGPPSAPRNLTVIGKTTSTLHLAWTAPADAGGRDDLLYHVSYIPQSQGQVSLTTYVRQLNDTEVEIRGNFKHCKLRLHVALQNVDIILLGLQSGWTYTFFVTAENGVSMFTSKVSNSRAAITLTMLPSGL